MSAKSMLELLHNIQIHMSAQTSKQAKEEISDIIRAILAKDRRFWLDDYYVRWGAVEKELHAIVDRNLRAKPDTRHE